MINKNRKIIESLERLNTVVKSAKQIIPVMSVFTYNYEKTEVRKIYNKLNDTIKLLDKLIKQYKTPKTKKKYKSVEELFHIYMKTQAIKTDDGMYKIIVPRFKKYLMENGGFWIENDMENEVLKLMGKGNVIHVYKKRIGLPSFGKGFNFDPSNRIYYII